MAQKSLPDLAPCPVFPRSPLPSLSGLHLVPQIRSVWACSWPSPSCFLCLECSSPLLPSTASCLSFGSPDLRPMTITSCPLYLAGFTLLQEPSSSQWSLPILSSLTILVTFWDYFDFKNVCTSYMRAETWSACPQLFSWHPEQYLVQVRGSIRIFGMLNECYTEKEFIDQIYCLNRSGALTIPFLSEPFLLEPSSFSSLTCFLYTSRSHPCGAAFRLLCRWLCVASLLHGGSFSSPVWWKALKDRMCVVCIFLCLSKPSRC